MARNIEPRYSDIFITDEMESIKDARVRIRTNIPMKWVEVLDTTEPRTVADFLHTVIAEWDGFDMELNRKNISELTLMDMRVLSSMIMSHIQNPQRPTSAGL